MTKIDKVFHELGDLYEFYKELRKYRLKNGRTFHSRKIRLSIRTQA